MKKIFFSKTHIFVGTVFADVETEIAVGGYAIELSASTKKSIFGVYHAIPTDEIVDSFEIDEVVYRDLELEKSKELKNEPNRFVKILSLLVLYHTIYKKVDRNP